MPVTLSVTLDCGDDQPNLIEQLRDAADEYHRRAEECECAANHLALMQSDPAYADRVKEAEELVDPEDDDDESVQSSDTVHAQG